MNYIFKLISIVIPILGYTQSYIVEEHFSNTAPTGWTSTSNVWNFARNENATGNYRNIYDLTTYAARFSSAANGNSIYIYIPVNFKADHNYTITFYTKRACSVVVNTNELPNQTTLLTTDAASNANCNSNWNTWYQWSFTILSNYTGAGYFQIWIKTVYGGPTSVYLDDLTIYETPIISLPIELLYFYGHKENDSNILEWATASEYQNDYFTLYRSVNGYDWMSILVMSGAGTSSIKHEYRYSDVALSDIAYYVLKQTDTDGKFKIHHPISVYNPRTYKTVLRCTDLLGRVLENSTGQARIVEYTDGTKVIIVGNRF
jgi:hypothetical protein